MEEIEIPDVELLDVVTFIEEDEYEDIFIWPKNPNRTKPKVNAHVLWESGWGIMISNPETGDPRTFLGMKWLTRFRVPFPVFEDIVKMCKSDNIFRIRRTNKMSIPVEFRVLVALRLLAKNHDDPSSSLSK